MWNTVSSLPRRGLLNYYYCMYIRVVCFKWPHVLEPYFPIPQYVSKYQKKKDLYRIYTTLLMEPLFGSAAGGSLSKALLFILTHIHAKVDTNIHLNSFLFLNQL